MSVAGTPAVPDTVFRQPLYIRHNCRRLQRPCACSSAPSLDLDNPSLTTVCLHDRFREGLSLSDQETGAFQAYFYHIMAAPGSGEHALRHLLGPFAWARSPLEDDLKQLQVRTIDAWANRSAIQTLLARSLLGPFVWARSPSEDDSK